MLKCIAVQILSGSVLLTDSGVLRYTHASTLTFLLTLIIYIFLMKNSYIGYDLIRYMLYSHKKQGLNTLSSVIIESIWLTFFCESDLKKTQILYL